MKFVTKLFRRRPYRVPAHKLYLAAAEQARAPLLFEDFQVPDTLDGRFDTLILHVFLLLHRLRRQGEEAVELSHEIVEVLVGDMDRTLREMGIADVGVGKRVKTMLRAFYGRIGAYDQGLEATDEAVLRESLTRNVYRGKAPDEAVVGAFADYVRRQGAALGAQPTERFITGEATFAAADRNTAEH